MIPGDRIRLAHPHRDMTVGEEGVVAGFSRRERGDLVIAHFDGRKETIPKRLLALVTTNPPERLRVSLPSTRE
jgi:hypothetical protein